MKVLLISSCIVIIMVCNVLSARIPRRIPEAPEKPPTTVKVFQPLQDKATFLNAVAKCQDMGWDLARVENKKEQEDLQKRVLNHKDMTERIWLNGEHWYSSWYMTPERDGSTHQLNYTNFHPGYNPEKTPSPACLTAIPLHANVKHPPHIYKWFANKCDELHVIVCQKFTP